MTRQAHAEAVAGHQHDLELAAAAVEALDVPAVDPGRTMDLQARHPVEFLERVAEPVVHEFLAAGRVDLHVVVPGLDGHELVDAQA